MSNIGCPISLNARRIEPYEDIIGKRVVAKLKKLSRKLKNKSWTHLISIYQGGSIH